MTWRFLSEGSPFGSTTVQDEHGMAHRVVLNRQVRRRHARQENSRTERLIDQEERHARVRQVTYKGPTPKQERGRKARKSRKGNTRA